VRLIPGVLGNAASTEEESFSDGLLEHPQYTQPREWKGRSIPDVLLSGNHGEIAKWRRAEAERLTAARRPDLWAAYLARKGDCAAPIFGPPTLPARVIELRGISLIHRLSQPIRSPRPRRSLRRASVFVHASARAFDGSTNKQRSDDL